MGIHKRLWDWCQRPKKRDSQHFFVRLSVWLHLPKVRMPELSLPLELISFLVSLPLAYGIMAFTLALMAGKCLDFTLSDNPLLPLPLIRDPYTTGILLYTPFFVPIGWIVTDSILSKLKRKRRKVLLFSALLLIIVPAGLTFGLNNGLFDSITISEVGVIDLTRCRATFNISNTGLTDVKIAKIEIGGLIFVRNSDFWSGLQIGDFLERGKQETTTIDYLYNPEVTPTTFTEGKYPVIIYTDGIATARSEIEAKISEVTEIYCVQAQLIYSREQTLGDQRYFSFGMKLDLTVSKSVGYIYSITIGNLTFTFSYPIYVDGNYYVPRYGHEDSLLSLEISSSYGHHSVNADNKYAKDVFLSQPIDSKTFRVGETYPITVRTMTNNNYTSLVTLTV